MKELERWFYIVMIAASFAGGMAWLTSIDSKATDAVKGVQEMRYNYDMDRKALEEIRLRLAHIDDALNKD